MKWTLPIYRSRASNGFYSLISVWLNPCLTFFMDNICCQNWFLLAPATSLTPPLFTPTTRCVWPRWTSTALTTTTLWPCTLMLSTQWSSTWPETSWLNTIRCVWLLPWKLGTLKMILLFPASWQYPEGIRKYDYIPNFAVRGLHYDIQKVIKNTKMPLQEMCPFVTN